MSHPILPPVDAPSWQLPHGADQRRDLALVHARVMDPATHFQIEGGVLILEGRIADIGTHIQPGSLPDSVPYLDCKGHVLAPGLLDIQVHFREPGQTHKETLATGSRSAVAGGITRVVCQPNTAPVMDSVLLVRSLQESARRTAYAHIETYAAVSKQMRGEELTDMQSLVDAGVVGFTDDGLPVSNAQLMRHALAYSQLCGVPIAQHAEDLVLSQGGCMNEGAMSFRLGVRGIPNASESVMVLRDLQLLEWVGGYYHVLHVSTGQAVEAIRHAKERGLNVTCEAAPHHFTLTDAALEGYNTLAKMNPPLRSERDRLALIEGLKDGTIDAIATDHAPHDDASKALPLSDASFGIVGVETLLPLSLALYHQGHLSLMEVLRKLTSEPARIIRSEAGRLSRGAPADLTVIDPDLPWTIDRHAFASKSHNSPFHGLSTKGRALATIVGGVLAFQRPF